VVGLGNPGAQYARTRHNAGFMALDALQARWGLGKAKSRFGSRLVEGTVRGAPPGMATGAEGAQRVVLMWPQTYMNEAGRAVGPARGHFKLALERVLVVYDEIDLHFGEVRVRHGGGTGGHNGLKSLTQALGGADFWRVRLGVGRPASTDSENVSGYVLAPFAEPASEVRALMDMGIAEIERLVFEGGSS
jgi:PTH1 family peptidyl-tRNA hydrolase